MTSPDELVHKSGLPAWLILSAFILGILLFLWLPAEDTNENRVLVFATAINVVCFIRYLVRLSAALRKSFPRHLLAGTLAGLAITPTTLFLMAFKTGLHAHGTPDFTAEQILSVINHTPIWGVAGMMVGALSSLLVKMISN